MVAMDIPPTFRGVLALKVANLAIKRGRKKATTRITAVLNATVRVVLHLAGFGLLTMAGFQLNIIAGYAVAGLSCFVMSTLMTQGSAAEDDSTEVRRAPDLRTGR